VRQVPLLSKTSRVDRIAPHALVGIDLGTTNSSIAIVGDNGPVVLSDSEGRKSVPSEVVWFNKEELKIVGKNNVAHDDPIFYSFKRCIGLTCGEISDSVKDSLQYSLIDSEDGLECLALSGECLVSPVALSAVVITYLIQSTGHSLHEIEGAVVAVPAHFSFSQKQATIRAAEEAGIEKVHLLQEPVAAALAYGIDGGSNGETVLVFDWGGGTFDVSVLQAFEGIMEILGTDGNQFLGGDDIDQLLVNHLYSSSVDKTLDVYKRCRAIKEQLASLEQSEISLENGDTVTITRNDLESLCRPLFEEIASVLNRIGNDLFIEWDNDPFDSIGPESTSKEPTGLTPSNTDPWAAPPRKITKVVLVGQITRLPMVVEYIKRVTGVTPCCSVDPGEAVAIGAATQAGILEGSVGSVELMDGSYSIDLHDRTTGFSNWQP
jgi:molecular chaperone DnaK (HSP70)